MFWAGFDGLQTKIVGGGNKTNKERFRDSTIRFGEKSENCQWSTKQRCRKRVEENGRARRKFRETNSMAKKRTQGEQKKCVSGRMKWRDIGNLVEGAL